MPFGLQQRCIRARSSIAIPFWKAGHAEDDTLILVAELLKGGNHLGGGGNVRPRPGACGDGGVGVRTEHLAGGYRGT